MAALVTVEFILIITIEPSVEQIARIDNDVGSNKVPYFAWSPLNVGQSPLFAVASDSLIKVYSLEQLKEDTASGKLQKQISFKSYFHSEKEILFLDFLNENLLIYLDPNNLLSILAVNRLKDAQEFKALPAA